MVDPVNLVCATWEVPKMPSRVFLVPIAKPGKDPRNAESGTPITPLCAASKLIEAVIYNSIPQQKEPRLDAVQCASRCNVGTEMRLTELMDCA